MHISKYNLACTNNMLKHYTRDRVSSKSNIDINKSHLNYTIGSTNPYKRLHEIIHNPDTKMLKRKDVNVMCDVVVTLPETIPQERADEFFSVITDFFKLKFCQKDGVKLNNFIGAYIHKDETLTQKELKCSENIICARYHEHFSFVPIVVRENGQKRVCANDVVTLKLLKTFHRDAEQYVSEHMNIPISNVGLTTGVSEKIKQYTGGKKGAFTVPELREQTELSNYLKSENKQLKEQNELLQNRNIELQSELNNSMRALKIWQEEEDITPIFEDVMTSL